MPVVSSLNYYLKFGVLTVEFSSCIYYFRSKMANISSINPEEFIPNSQARLFQIFLVTQHHLFSWRRAGGFENVEIEIQGFMNMYVFRRNIVVEEYYEALRTAKTIPEFEGGKLVISELPIFG
jgi:hypothetical protein